jgi:hypothetical protein
MTGTTACVGELIVFIRTNDFNVIMLYIGCGECPFHCDAMGTTAINTLYAGKKLWICISSEDIKTLIDCSCVQLNDICAVDNLFPLQLLSALNTYKEDHCITVWYAIQEEKQTMFVPSLFGHCTSNVRFLLIANIASLSQDLL